MFSSSRNREQDSPSQPSSDGGWRARISRTPFYLVALVLLCIATILMFVSLFTNNWQKTVTYRAAPVNFYETYGLWYRCTRYNLNWYYANGYPTGYANFQPPPMDYCSGIDYDRSIQITFWKHFFLWYIRIFRNIRRKLCWMFVEIKVDLKWRIFSEYL